MVDVSPGGILARVNRAPPATPKNGETFWKCVKFHSQRKGLMLPP